LLIDIHSQIFHHTTPLKGLTITKISGTQLKGLTITKISESREMMLVRNTKSCTLRCINATEGRHADTFAGASNLPQK